MKLYPGRGKKIVKYEGACQIINSETLFFNVNDFFLNLS